MCIRYMDAASTAVQGLQWAVAHASTSELVKQQLNAVHDNCSDCELLQ